MGSLQEVKRNPLSCTPGFPLIAHCQSHGFYGLSHHSAGMFEAVLGLYILCFAELLGCISQIRIAIHKIVQKNRHCNDCKTYYCTVYSVGSLLNMNISSVLLLCHFKTLLYTGRIKFLFLYDSELYGLVIDCSTNLTVKLYSKYESCLISNHVPHIAMHRM